MATKHNNASSSELEKLSEENATRQKNEIEFINKGTPGSWAILAMADPSFDAFSKGLSNKDRFLNLVVTGSDRKAIFFDVLTCPEASEEPRSPNEARETWQDRYKIRFQQAIPDYPMLARMWDIFMYVSYKQEDVRQLRSECLRVRSTTSNKRAIAGLSKIITACDDAMKSDSGLLFVPD